MLKLISFLIGFDTAQPGNNLFRYKIYDQEIVIRVELGSAELNPTKLSVRGIRGR